MTGRQRCRMQKLYKLLAMVDDALIAPGATNTERLLGYGAGVCGAIFAGTTGALQGISGFGIVLLIVGGFDLFGGAVVNATPSCSRRFHTGKRSRGSALGFIAGHIHTLVLAGRAAHCNAVGNSHCRLCGCSTDRSAYRLCPQSVPTAGSVWACRHPHRYLPRDTAAKPRRGMGNPRLGY